MFALCRGSAECRQGMLLLVQQGWPETRHHVDTLALVSPHVSFDNCWAQTWRRGRDEWVSETGIYRCWVQAAVSEFDIKKNNAQQCTVWPGMNSSFNCDKSSCCSLSGLRVGEDGICNKCGSQCPILPGFVSHWPRFSDSAVISQCKQLSLKLRHLWWLTHCSQQIQWHCDHAITSLLLPSDVQPRI